MTTNDNKLFKPKVAVKYIKQKYPLVSMQQPGGQRQRGYCHQSVGYSVSSDEFPGVRYSVSSDEFLELFELVWSDSEQWRYCSEPRYPPPTC